MNKKRAVVQAAEGTVADELEYLGTGRIKTFLRSQSLASYLFCLVSSFPTCRSTFSL